MTDTDALVVTQEDQLLREIGAILDHPSLYMGGPSRQSIQKARAILPIIERARLEAAKAGLEAAAKVADGFCTDRTDDVATGIRNIDPAAIAAIGGGVEAIRLQGQQEGFAAAVHWLRERGAMKPRTTLWQAAETLADQMEQSRIAGAAKEPT